nr:hypothetical protein [Paenibacillus agricola]
MQIHRSRDLVNWHLVDRPLNRVSKLPASCCRNTLMKNNV